MTARNILKAFSTIAINLSMVLSFGQSTTEKPNVIVIVADDMNMWSMSKDYRELRTPNLDKLKEQSLFYKNASCAAPVCIPSRASFFSGKSPQTTGAYLNNRNAWEANSLSSTEVIPETFKRNGYTTWGRGKIFHAPINGDRQNIMFDNKVVEGGFGPYAPEEYHYAKSKWFSIKPWEGPDSDFADVRNTDAAIAFLEEKQERPFFLFLGLYRPHTPYTAPKRFFDQYKDVEFNNPPGYMENDLDDVPLPGRELVDSLKKYKKRGLHKIEVYKELLRGYCANYSFADYNIGRVVDALDNSPYRDNTIILFYSDNGFHNGTKNHWVKSTLWEQADAVPFLVRLPDKKGGQRNQTINLIDVFPTLIEYCNLKAPSHSLDGKSMVQTFVNELYEWDRPGFTCYGENYSSLRDERYRYIRYPDGSEELYDHESDPYEHHNLASSKNYRAVKNRLAKNVPSHFAQSLGGRREETAN